MADFLAGQIPTAAELELATQAGEVIPGGRARRITDSSDSTSTTRVAVLRLDDAAIKAGRLYEICTGMGQIDGATANDTLIVEILYTTDGSTPTTSSTLLVGAATEVIQPNAARAVPWMISTTYTPAADETLSLLLTIKHGVGTGAMHLMGSGTDKIIEMKIVDRGVDGGDVGVDL